LADQSGRASEPLALFGGTFDPIHLGHLIAAEEVAERLELPRIAFVPCGAAPHKGNLAASAEQRLAMCHLAVKGNPRFHASRMEVDRPGPSYAIDTVRAMAQRRPAESVYFIIGSDAFGLLDSWYEWRELVELCTFVVMRRPGEEAPSREPVVPHAVSVDIRGVEVSSSEVRTRLREGRSVRYLVPEGVRLYIVAHGLYGAQAGVDAGAQG
jgi:nicotinate-nucleotide adenylyltransferase